MIICRNISKAFGAQCVIDSFSYDFQDNGFYLLLGESGSGKTTFLNILSGFLTFESGEIIWNGRAFEGRVRHENTEDFDYITQDPFFVDFLSVADNLRLITEDDGRIGETLKRLGLSDKSDRMPLTLSGGEKQRLALARAILGEKKVLFLDEPTASLDSENKREIFEYLAKLGKDFLIICSSHDAEAKKYADRIIEFTKVKREASPGEKAVRHKDNKVSFYAEKKSGKKPDKYLKKWFSSGRRKKSANPLFLVFLALSLFLCILADTPKNKLETSIEYMYRINMMSVTVHNLKWSDIAPDDNSVREVVIHYGRSCPDGSGDLGEDVIFRPSPDYDMSLKVLPEDAKNFKHSDNILCGGYFTKPDQVILSREMADFISPSDPEKLIGEQISKNVFGIGNVSLEVVGIFDYFDKADKEYLRAIDIDIADGERYNASNYADLCFVNSALIAGLEENDAFFTNSGQRVYHIYFDSFNAMKSYYDRHYKELISHEGVTVGYDNVNVELQFVFAAMFYILLPIAAFMALFSVLFFALLRKTELEYNHRFISVFEYSGYPKSLVIRRFIRLNFFDLVKMLFSALIITLPLTFVINLVNNRFLIVGFQIFSYNYLIIASFVLFVLAVSLISVNLMFRRVRASSWYENIIASRDLI